MAINLARAKKTAKKTLIWASFIILPIFALASVMYVVEGSLPGSNIKSFWDALWLVVVTMSTVGYGDIVPLGQTGRLVAVFAMFLGVVFIATLTATIASRLIERVVKGLGATKVGNLKNHIIILGYNENGARIIQDLQQECMARGTQIVLVTEKEVPSNLPENVILVKGDPTRLETLERVHADKAKTAVILADFEDNARGTDSKVIITTLAVKRISGGKCRVVCEVLLNEDLEYLENAHADEVVVRSEVAGNLLSRAVNNPGVSDLMQHLLTVTSPGSICRMTIPESFFGKTYEEFIIGIYRESKTVPIALIRNDETVINPAPTEVLTAGDEAFVVSPTFAQCPLPRR